MYMCVTKLSNRMRQKLPELKGEIYKSMITIGDINIPLSVMTIYHREKGEY